MNDELGSERDHLARMVSFSDSGIGASWQDFGHLLLREGNASVSLTCAHEVHKFACDQMGFWAAEWYFSPAYSPNTVAKSEMEGWQILRQGFFDALLENVPNIRDSLEQYQELSLFIDSLRRRVEYNKTRAFRKLAAIVLANASFVFKKIGFHGIARNLYARSLFPKGTVGRP